jgi:hypothetical protein
MSNDAKIPSGTAVCYRRLLLRGMDGIPPAQRDGVVASVPKLSESSALTGPVPLMDPEDMAQGPGVASKAHRAAAGAPAVRPCLAAPRWAALARGWPGRLEAADARRAPACGHDRRWALRTAREPNCRGPNGFASKISSLPLLEVRIT